MDFLQITAIGDQIGFQRAKGSNNRYRNEGSDVSVEGKYEEKNTKCSHLSKTLMRLWSWDPTKVLPRKSQGIEIIHKRSTIVHQPYLFYARFFNNRTSTILILCKTFQPVMEQK